MLKKGLKTIRKKGINYIIKENQINKYTPWLGDILNYFYDFFMKKIVFPKKFGGDMIKHYEILKKEFKNINQQEVLELATGSGNAVYFLNNDNHYVGIDVSPGLLRQAAKRFRNFGFREAELFLASAEDIPFQDNIFDGCMCHLSFNFFSNLEKVIQELTRVSKDKSFFLGSIPIPERCQPNTTIRGKLYSEKELKIFFEKQGWRFESLPQTNGVLFYFKATRRAEKGDRS